MVRRQQTQREKFACPHCGADVMVGAAVCRECGSDAATGWQEQEEIDYQSLDLPAGYRDPDRVDFGGMLSERRPWWWLLLAVVLALVLLAVAVLR